MYVAGGRSGFIGSNFAQELHRRGANVTVQGLHKDKKPYFKGSNFPHIIDLSVSSDIPEGTDYVFHCAAHTSGAKEMVETPEAQIHVNAFMNSNLLEDAAKKGVKKFLFISSSAVYPDCAVPIDETMGFNLEPPRKFFGPAWMKRYSEKLMEFYHMQYGMSCVVIRPSNAYGPNSSFDLEYSHVLPALIRKFVEKQNPLEVWGNPDVSRDFIYIDDLVRGSLMAFEATDGFNVFNIATGELQTIGSAVDHIEDLTGYKGKIVYNADKPTTVQFRSLSVEKATKRLGFESSVGFKEGLERTIRWYKESL